MNSFLYRLLLVCLAVSGIGSYSAVAQCNNNYSITLPGQATQTVNNGTGTFSSIYCPGPTVSNQIVIQLNNNTGDIRFELFEVSQYVPFPGNNQDPLPPIDGVLVGRADLLSGQRVTFPVSPTRKLYELRNLLTACNNAKQQIIRVTLEPALSLVASVNGTGLGTTTTICPGTQVTLTASGGPSGAIYTFRDITGGIIGRNDTGVLSVTPTTSTSYTVTTNVPTCGANDVTQTIRIATSLSLTSDDADNIVNPPQTVTLTASGSSNGSYTWTQTQIGGVATPLAGNGATQTVTPTVTTTYTATANNAASCGPASLTLRPAGPLPVSLVSFEAARSRTGAQLRWTTASEQNNAYFAVERSTDGEAFAPIGKVTGAGTTSRRTDYSFVDNKLPGTLGGLVYYRLQQVDHDGSATYSQVQVVQVSQTNGKFDAEAFPNPYDRTLTVRFRSLGAGVATYVLHDAIGSTRLSGSLPTKATGVQELPLPQATALPAGIYYLTIRQGSQQQVLKLQHR